MGFTSTLRPREFVIDDNNYTSHALNPIVGGETKNRGRAPRDWAKEPFGSLPYAKAFDIPLIPESEWDARIEEGEKTKTFLSHICDQKKLVSLDQNGTNYCWCNAVITAMEILQARTGQPIVKLSPASVAAPIKGYRNQGGWGGEALDYIIKNGVAPASLWPPNAINRSYFDKQEVKDARDDYKVTEWYELENRNFNQLMTLLFLRIPVPIGLNWWSHEVCACDPVKLSSGYGVRIRNSWSDSYGDHGFAVLTRSKATPDDAVAPRVLMAA